MSLSLLDLSRHHCRWPVDDAHDSGGHRFCGEVAARGSSYCAAHAARAVGTGTQGERSALQVLRHQAMRETAEE
ncbi:GcrA family cell cycle regulator [Hoeflea sp. YIM 152468]|uniref:GcrA family cell cycle regulator n=1 Tax=Hoeflea sp. YIM 152468 TaxID=3031759 RepID=UPI0023DB0381|nr:GcrA family cell cycle regulator [Hoeflea sp. YIM 152468]MDF1606976.1 GcrA family cell cycle regulator [Hoeflea sp. YIM 152468]